MTEEWGPWIEHDGRGCPVPVGTFTEEIGENPEGHSTHACGYLREIEVPSWDSKNFGKRIGRYVYGRVLRYRIRKPKGLAILEGLLERLPNGVDA